eukprot:gene9370-12659_t
MAGLNPDVPTLRRTVSAVRPYLATALRERYGAELLAVYIYPAQEVFCNKPLQQLSDLAGRRTRVSSSTQADFISAVGGTPVYTEFTQIMTNMKSGNTDCAVTGTMSGHTLGLHEVTSALYTMPLSWGVAVFAANRESFNALPVDLQALLRKELPRLEAAVWAQSERDTDEGIACNTGAASCGKPTKGRMVAVRPSPQDEARRKEIFATRVLPGWVQRCGPECAKAWNQTLAPVPHFPRRATAIVYGVAVLFLATVAAVASLIIWDGRQKAISDHENLAVRFVSGSEAALNRSLLSVDMLVAGANE